MQWFSNYHASRELFVNRFLGPTSRVSDSEGVGWDLRICVSHKFPGGADVLACLEIKL